MKIQFGTGLNGDQFWVKVDGRTAVCGRGLTWGERDGQSAPYFHFCRRAVESLGVNTRSLGTGYARGANYSESNFSTVSEEIEIPDDHPVALHFEVYKNYQEALECGDDEQALACLRWMRQYDWLDVKDEEVRNECADARIIAAVNAALPPGWRMINIRGAMQFGNTQNITYQWGHDSFYSRDILPTIGMESLVKEYLCHFRAMVKLIRDHYCTHNKEFWESVALGL